MKKLFIGSAISALFLTSGFILYQSQHSNSLSDLIEANVEALSREESPCDNFNGHRRILNGNERIYDCCHAEKPAEAEKTANDGKQVFQTGNHCVAAPAVDVDKLY